MIVTANDPIAQQSIVERVIASPGYFENTPIVLVVEDENPSRVALEPRPPVSLIIDPKELEIPLALITIPTLATSADVPP